MVEYLPTGRAYRGGYFPSLVAEEILRGPYSVSKSDYSNQTDNLGNAQVKRVV